jgi:voltage-gated potassium channel
VKAIFFPSGDQTGSWQAAVVPHPGINGGIDEQRERAARAVPLPETPRGGAVVIAAITTVATVCFGLLMTVIDHKNFTTLGQGLWWAVQTVPTVGYGDHVPTNVGGRLVGAFVMLLGLAFLAVVTAAITSSFVSRATEERARHADDVRALAPEDDAQGITKRLDRIEALLRERS